MKRLTVSALAALLLVSCSLSRHVADTMSRVEHQYESVKEWRELPLRTITWNQALDIMRRENPDMQSAQRSIEKAERETLRVYTDLIPTVSYYGYVNKSLRSLSEKWQKDDVTENINVNFSVPTLTQVPYRVYASRATAYAAVKAKEGKERELTSKLYVLIRKHELDERAARISEQGGAAASTSDPMNALKQDNADDTYSAETAKLLGDSSARWNILPETMPHVRWEDYRDKTEHLDPLIICEYALKLEKAYLAQYSVALNYLPTINTSLYSPSLFSSTGGTYSGTFLSSDDTRINLSLSYTLDTRLSTWERYKDNKDAYDKARRDVKSGLMEHRAKLNSLRRSMEDYGAWKSFMQKRMDFLRHAPTETATEFLERQKDVADMELELVNQEKSGVETEGALIVEYGLPQK